MSSLTLIGAHRAVSELLENRPKSWDVVRFKGLFERLDRRNVDLAYEMLSLRSTGEVVARAEMGGRQEPDESSLPKYLVAEIDDLVVNPMWLIGGGIGVSRRAGAVSPDYRVFRSHGALHPRFVHHLLRSQPYLDQYLLYTRAQTTFDRRVQQSDLDNLPLPVPPLEEQRAIADYLDRETVRIDTLIEEQQRLIEMLRERRRLAITNAIPPRPSVGSGADKLGRTARIGNGSTPRRENRAYWDGGDVPWLNSSVVNQTRVHSAVEFTTAAALAECHLPIVPPGSVLVGLTGQGKTRGMATILDIEATVNQHLAYVTPDRAKWWPDYLLWLLTAAYDDLRRISEENGSTKGGLTCEALKQLRVIIPPIDEQRRIAFHLDERTAKTDTLIAETERFIELARERRSALITAAVTGQIDVREVA
ncbi:type I restriction enzyme S subunit [Streptomyces achromogenes]|uniref:Type I restriction enzyme S subunit n=1 Tax=Streptomyces achromogenes TaxID=67255 RepID=A0ABU0PZ45_STRAH|nr:restriction endonuclease subunit S [Streptomyces achromogenes]MDQ0683680.1 type I restriction enzyme S subunit [Streptomyces achromogenes]